MKQVFIILGEPMWRKKINFKFPSEPTIVFDDLPNFKGRENSEGFKRRFNDKLRNEHNYIVYVTKYKDNIEIIKGQYPNIPVEVIYNDSKRHCG